MNKDKTAVDASKEAEVATEDAVTNEIQKNIAAMFEASVAGLRADIEKSLDAKLDKFSAAAEARNKAADLAEKRAGIYNPEIQSKRKPRNDQFRKFVGALKAGDHDVLQKELSSLSDGAGGYFLESEMEAEIVVLAATYGNARREFFVTPIDGKSIKINRLVTDVEVYWTGQAEAKTTTNATFGQLEIVAKKLAAIVIVTDELLEDVSFDLLGFLQERIARAMARKEDEAGAKGDGSADFGGFTGFLNAVGVARVYVASANDVTVDDLIDLQDAVPADALSGAKYHMHRSMLSRVRKLKDGAGAYLYAPATSGTPSSISGYPVVLWEAFAGDAVNLVAFGNLRFACWLVNKGGIAAAVSNEATVRNAADDGDVQLFKHDMTALRMVERVGLGVVNPTFISVLTVGEESA